MPECARLLESVAGALKYKTCLKAQQIPDPLESFYNTRGHSGYKNEHIADIRKLYSVYSNSLIEH